MELGEATPPGSPAGRAAWRPRDLWPLALGLAGAVALPFLARRDPSVAGAAADLAQATLYAIVAVLCFVAVRRLRHDPLPLRRGWRLLGLGSLLAFLAYLTLIAMDLAAVPVPGQGIVLLLAVINAVGFIGLVMLSPPELARGSRLRLALDGLIAGGSLLFLVLALSAGQALPSGASAPSPSDLLYPAIDAAGLMVAVMVYLQVRRALPPWYLAIAFGAALVFLADTVFAAGFIPAWAAESSFLLYLGLLGTAAALAHPWPEHKTHRETLAAQAAVYVPFGLAIAGATYERSQGSLVAEHFFLLMAIVVAVVIRTVLALGENRRLYASFDATDAFKTQLLRFISHEIANPLSPLILQTHLLRDGNASDPARAWQAVDRSIGRLESLSRDVRLMALAETKKIVQSTEVADIASRVAAAVQAHQAVAQQRKVTLRSDLPQHTLAVPVDGERFDQVVDNLLSNALKFTPAGGSIDVRLWRAPGGLAVLEVQDSGAGMTVEQQAKLFTAFGRPQGTTAPGLGLGLYLCKAIIDGHEGRISATSEGAGKGSKFRVELPPARPGPRLSKDGGSGLPKTPAMPRLPADLPVSASPAPNDPGHGASATAANS